MDIVAVVDNQGKSAVFGDNIILRIYTKADNGWSKKAEMKYLIGGQPTPLGVKNSLKGIEAWLGECKLMIAKEVSGVYYTFFEGLFFDIWEMDGNPEEYLDYVYHSELQEQMKETVQKKAVAPEMVREGCYYVDLKEVMRDTTAQTSKQVLLPFFAEGNFKELIIDCEHIPRWFENELPAMGLRAEAQKFRDGLKLTVFKD